MDTQPSPPPPPVSKNHLAQEPTPGSAVKFSHHFFYQGSRFFMFMVDVGQLFSPLQPSQLRFTPLVFICQRG